MRHNSNGARSGGLLLLLLLRNSYHRPNDSAAIQLGRKPPIGCRRVQRLPISHWQADFWSKPIASTGQAPVSDRSRVAEPDESN